MTPAEQREQQLARLQALREKISQTNYEFVRKELMLNLDLDILNLLNDQMFEQNYEFKNQAKEDKLSSIKR